MAKDYKFKIGDKVKITKYIIFKIGDNELCPYSPNSDNVGEYFNKPMIVIAREKSSLGNLYSLSGETGEDHIAWIYEKQLERV